MNARNDRQVARHQAQRNTPRPSLFAGMDAYEVDGDIPLVRILSTLESSRRPYLPAPSKRTNKRKGYSAAWQVKALYALMGAGVLALLTSFAIVLHNGQVSSSKTTTNLSHSNPLAAMIAPPLEAPAPPAAPLAQAQSAIIENVMASTLQEVTAERPEPVAPVVTEQNTPTTPPALNTAAVTAHTPNAKVRRQNTPLRQDEDVALLEAMFAHTGSRKKAPTSAAEDLKTRCGGLVGAAAATCQASVCVQNPSSSVCHTDQ
ncbi:MAG: hypothetical protein Q7U28_19405 [Aquabacterium sp.]|nr:hypothetical protein [Aquabacterium sp.]